MADNQKLDQRFQPQGDPVINPPLCMPTSQISNLQPTQQPPPPPQQQPQPQLQQTHHQFKNYPHPRNPAPRQNINRGYYPVTGVPLRHGISMDQAQIRYVSPMYMVSIWVYPINRNVF